MRNYKIYLMLLGFAIFTGATFNLAKYSVSFFAPSSAAALRFGLAAVVMFIILMGREGWKKRQVRMNARGYILLGIIGIFGFNALFFLGLNYTSPINGALIMGTNPVLTTIFARAILKDPINKQQVLGLVFALFGVILVITEGSREAIANLSFSIGDIFILLGNTCWALYGVLGKKYLKESSTLATTTYTMIIGAICLVVISMTSVNPVPLVQVPMGGWGAIVFMGLFTSVLGYLWWNQGIRELGASKTSLFFNLVPVVTLMISFFTGTTITIFQILGAVLVISGVLTASGMLSRSSGRSRPNKKRARPHPFKI